MQKNYSWNPITCICDNIKHVKHIVYKSVIACDEIIYVMNIVSTNVSINSDDKKVRYKKVCYILHTVLLVFMLLYMIAIICYHYAKNESKLKKCIAVLKI